MELLLDNQVINNRLLLGTALFPSLELMKDAIITSAVNVVTVSLRRQLTETTTPNHFWQILKSLPCSLLPNTAGCFNAKDAIYTAQLAQELFETRWIKLEVIGDATTLQPHPYELLKACEKLINMDFIVFPYCTEDLVVCQHLVEMGCQILMPWGAPIGSGKGLLNYYGLKMLRARFPETTLIIDAGIGSPSHAVMAMELGYEGVLLNSAVALADDPIKMAQAFSLAVASGRLAYEAGRMPEREFARSSTPDNNLWHIL